MSNMLKLPEHMVFGLDIGTRSIVGSVGYMDSGAASWSCMFASFAEIG